MALRKSTCYYAYTFGVKLRKIYDMRFNALIKNKCKNI